MIKTIKKISIIFVILIIIYIALLTITSCIPKSWIKDNIEESIIYFYDSKIDETIYVSGFTDAIMFDLNYRIDSDKPLESILKAIVISDENAVIDPVLRL